MFGPVQPTFRTTVGTYLKHNSPTPSELACLKQLFADLWVRPVNVPNKHLYNGIWQLYDCNHVIEISMGPRPQVLTIYKGVVPGLLGSGTNAP